MGLFAATGTHAQVVLDRSALPIHQPAGPPITVLDARDVKPPPRFEVAAPKGAPNVVIVLLDDFGFGQSSAFGGPIPMPNVDRLAAEGLRYNRFHTTAMCAPTRVALLTGHNHHAANMGSLPELATAFPGNTAVRPLTVTPLAEILKQNGYSTAAFGKSHETPSWELSSVGPFTRWPTGSGFEKFYGFMGGETNQWAPLVYDGTTPVEIKPDPNYHFTVDMTDKAIDWLAAQRALTPDKPFFLYYATAATHAPHHAPKEWIDKFTGQFSMGWDRLREQTFARQKAMGIVPPGTELTTRPKEIRAWDELTADEQRLFERQMEAFAGYAAHTDWQIGRLLDTLQQLKVLDNTLVVLILGDNGASAEGGPDGTDNELRGVNGIVRKASDMMGLIDDWGGPSSVPHYAVGWAWAGNTPLQWTKQVAGHFGGTRNGMIIHWPQVVHGGGGVRSQFHHVIDIAPTVLEAAGIPQPKSVNGVAQRPMDGVSMVYTFADPKAKDRRTTQYFETFGNRGIYSHGWMASTRHSTPWVLAPLPALTDDVWELYNVDQDFSQANDLAARYPAKLEELQALYLEEAARNNALPIDDRRPERLVASVAGRPDLLGGRTSMTVYPGMSRMNENVLINVKGVRHTVVADVDVKDSRASGVIIAQGGRFGGWALYMKDGKVSHEYNFFGDERTKVTGDAALGAGTHQIEYEFIPDSDKPGASGTSILRADGRDVARANVPKTHPFSFSGDEGADVGFDGETTVSNDYQQGNNAFTGRIMAVTITQK